MKRWLLFLVSVPILGLCFTGCSSYRVLPDGYMLRGETKYVSIPRMLSVDAGPVFMEDQAWPGGKPPLQNKKLSLRQGRVLHRIGYDKKSYSVMFRSHAHSPIDMFAVVNSESFKKEGNTVRLLNISNLQRKNTEDGKWYFSMEQAGGQRFYHAYIPVSEELFREKHVSLIFPLSKDQTDFSEIEKIVNENVKRYNNSMFLPKKTVSEVCPDAAYANYYHGYFIPDHAFVKNKYMLLAAYLPKPDGTRELIYYTLLKGYRMGAFRICPGEYILEYLTLDGKIRWSTTFSPKPEEESN